MPYNFTIVDERTTLPIPGWIEFRKGDGKTGRWPVDADGIEFEGHEWWGMDRIAIGAEGYTEYSEPLDFEEGDYQYRLQKSVLIWPWVIAGVIATGAVMYFAQHRKTK